MKRGLWRGVKLSMLGFVLGAVLWPGRTWGEADRPAQTELTISAAISLKAALEGIRDGYATEHPAVMLTFNFGASGALQQQIENGAPVDVFLSAGTKPMDALAKAGWIVPATKRNLFGNQLVLITPRDKPAVTQISDLTNAAVQHVAVGEPQSVPVGQYTQETLVALKLADALKPKLVYAKDVRQVLTYVETGNADAGFVYATDARLTDKVQVVETVPAKLHAPIVYPVAVVAATRQAAAAQAFVDYLATVPARAIVEKLGFTLLDQ